MFKKSFIPYIDVFIEKPPWNFRRINLGGSYLFPVYDTSSWYNAESKCQQYGGTLASPYSRQDLNIWSENFRIDSISNFWTDIHNEKWTSGGKGT